MGTHNTVCEKYNNARMEQLREVIAVQTHTLHMAVIYVDIHTHMGELQGATINTNDGIT